MRLVARLVGQPEAEVVELADSAEVLVTWTEDVPAYGTVGGAIVRVDTEKRARQYDLRNVAECRLELTAEERRARSPMPKPEPEPEPEVPQALEIAYGDSGLRILAPDELLLVESMPGYIVATPPRIADIERVELDDPETVRISLVGDRQTLAFAGLNGTAAGIPIRNISGFRLVPWTPEPGKEPAGAEKPAHELAGADA